ncbi:hypothetical protein FVA81_01635 (plasmid) [Rhizobium sp. WL3]|uniref:DUF6030 family protein n=1 Tax=Rhizobium sp. WL3 TaxID=2603277 RepID=UPI0011C2031E|nr:DUF6030 family protein [Rhizobium sp. WL3]QEE43376.1 hypothetical protein FVA81_01635 [Rhizobium sp. WL3]
MKPEPQIQLKQSGRAEKSGLLPISLWMGGVFAIIFATFLLADGQRNLHRLTGQPIAYPPDSFKPSKTSRGGNTVHDQTSDRAPTSLLLSTSAIEIKPLERLGDPRERCAEMATQGYEQPRYLSSEYFSQCTVMFIDGEGEAAPSVFIQIQTDPSGGVSSFRLKFNTDETDAQNLIQEGLNALQRFGGFGQTDDSFFPALASRIQKWDSFRILWGRYSLAMHREVSDATRFNLLGRLQHISQPVSGIWQNELLAE